MVFQTLLKMCFFIFNVISDLMNYFVFVVISIIIDICMVVQLRRTLDEKLKKSQSLNQKQNETKKAESEEAVNKAIKMVVLNSAIGILLNFLFVLFLFLMSLPNSIIKLILTRVTWILILISSISFNIYLIVNFMALFKIFLISYILSLCLFKCLFTIGLTRNFLMVIKG